MLRFYNVRISGGFVVKSPRKVGYLTGNWSLTSNMYIETLKMAILIRA